MTKKSILFSILSQLTSILHVLHVYHTLHLREIDKILRRYDFACPILAYFLFYKNLTLFIEEYSAMADRRSWVHKYMMSSIMYLSCINKYRRSYRNIEYICPITTFDSLSLSLSLSLSVIMGEISFRISKQTHQY